MEKQFCLSKLCKGYRIVLEESFAHEKMEGKTQDKRWYEQILCAFGHIMLYAESPEFILEYYTATARPTATKIYEKFKNVPGVKLDNHFSGYESVLYFPAHLLDE